MPRPTKRTPEQKREAKRISLQKWRKKNPDKARELDRAQRIKNPEAARKSDREAYWRNPERHRADALAYRQRHLEERRAYNRAWRLRNPEKVREQNATYGPKYLAENAERVKQYQREHAEEARARARLRATRKKGAPGKHTAADIAALFELQSGLCAYFSVCGNKITKSGKGKYHIDHIEPIAPKDKSRPVGSNDPSNLQLTCAACNMKKKSADPYEFTQRYAGTLFPDLPKSPKKKSPKKGKK